MSNIVKDVRSFELPGHSPCGLATDGKLLWISDVDSGMIYEIDTETTSMVREFKAVVHRPAHICYDGKHLWQYDEESMTLFRTDLSSDEVVPFSPVGGGINVPCYGLACDKEYLWFLTPDYPYFPIEKNTIHQVEASWKLQEKSFDAPSHGSRGLFFDGSYLWTLDNAKSEIYMFDPKGTVINSIYVPGMTLLSIVKIDDNLWSINYKDQKLYRYALDEKVAFSIYNSRRSSIKMTETFRNQGPRVIRKWETCFPIPKNYVNQELIGEVEFSDRPSDHLSTNWDEDSGKVARFVFDELHPGDSRIVTMSFQIRTWDVRFHLYPEKAADLDAVPDEIRNVYMVSNVEKRSPETLEILQRLNALFQLDENALKEIVDNAVGDEENPYWIARNLYDHVIDEIEYILPYRHITCGRIIENGEGSCTNQAHLYMALCQAAGLPARYLAGYTIWREDSRFGYINHSIPEVFIPGFGWIPVDTTQFMFLPAYENSPASRSRAFGSLSNRFFVSEIKGDYDSEYQRWSFLETDKILLEGQTALGGGYYIDWRFVD